MTQSYKVLVVDDEVSILQTIKGALEDEGYQVVLAQNAEQAETLIAKEDPHVVLLDVWLTGVTGPGGRPGQEGLKILEAAQPKSSSVFVIMSGHGTIETAVRATKSGAFDFLEKPIGLEKLLVTVKNAAHFCDLKRENESLRARVSSLRPVIGQSASIDALRQLAVRVASTNAWVLITGENGTGKEVFAHFIHSHSQRATKAFVEVNCAAIPEELIESELFGHEKGAFTGAVSLRRGKFELAHGGTLFLDEIADMSLKAQAKVLRILQEQRFERVGGTQSVHVDVRVIAATNKNLVDEIKQGRFREDLFHRLNVIPFKLPPLRSRTEDIPLLVEHFLSIYGDAAQFDGKRRGFSPEAVEYLKHQSWPGNVRQLKNFVERVLILSPSPQVGLSELRELVSEGVPESLNAAVQAGAASATLSLDEKLAHQTLKDARSEFERAYIVKKLAENGWNVSRAAQALGVERTNLHRKMKSLGIEGPEEGREDP